MSERREYGAGSIYHRRSDNRWVGTLEAGWTVTGGRRRVAVTGKTEAEVRRKLRDKKRQLQTEGAPTSTRTSVKTWATALLTMTKRTLRPKKWATNASTAM